LQKPDFDVGIIGGGPAGSSLAAYLAKAGISNVVFEGDIFPRPHVGESLVPSSTRVFKELGFLKIMEKNSFPRKYGAVWTVESNALTADHDWEGLPPDNQVNIRFEEREQPGVDQNYTYHVDRAKFDELLLEHAEKLGATIYAGVTVKNVEFDSDEFPTVQLSTSMRKSKIKVRMIVDASGRRTFLGNRLKLKVNDPVFDQYALHTWFENFDRGISNRKDYIFIHFVPITNTWVWQIPISDSVTSIGLVTPKKSFIGSKQDREEFFWETLKARPELYENLKQADQLSPLKAEGDYSYSMSQICGDRFILIGDAARFVDPIFSSGVSVALNSARFASRDIINSIEKGEFSRGNFIKYETKIQRGIKNWYNFISLYYRLNILFTYFINKPRYRLDILKLLQGDVYDDDEPRVLNEMRNIVTLVEKDENHIWHDLLGDLGADSLGITLPDNES